MSTAASAKPKVKKPRPANPTCANESCRHPNSFHVKRDEKTHRRKCTAFGCSCANYVKPKKT